MAVLLQALVALERAAMAVLPDHALARVAPAPAAAQVELQSAAELASEVVRPSAAVMVSAEALQRKVQLASTVKLMTGAAVTERPTELASAAAPVSVEALQRKAKLASTVERMTGVAATTAQLTELASAATLQGNGVAVATRAPAERGAERVRVATKPAVL